MSKVANTFHQSSVLISILTRKRGLNNQSTESDQKSILINFLQNAAKYTLSYKFSIY